MLNYNIGVFLRHTEMENMYIRELIEIVAQDTKAYTFKFTLYDGESAYDLTGRNVYLITKSKSDTIVQDKCTVTDAKSGLAQITLPNDMFCEEGTYQAEVQVWEGTSRLTSLPFDYTVRLSLQTNKSIIADTRYSLLQEALENVAEADGISTEALKTANEAKAIVDVLVPQTNEASQNAQEALDRALDVATKTELDERITLDGETKPNFNFIRQNVMQDGLIELDLAVNSKTTKTYKTGIAMYQFSFIHYGSNAYPVSPVTSYNLDTKIGCCIQINENKSFSVRYGRTTDFYYEDIGSVIKAKEGVRYNVVIFINKNMITFIIEGDGNRVVKTYTEQNDIPLNNRVQFLTGFYIGSGAVENGIVDLMTYERTIEPREIQHNLSVLNNSPSISELHITDAQGNVNQFAIATDSHHVATRGNRTQDSINQVFYAQNGKEFIADSTGKINVSNGLEGWVNKAEIKGQTVKNVLQTAINYKTSEGRISKAINIPIILDANKQYTITANTLKTSGIANVRLQLKDADGAMVTIPLETSSVGISYYLYTTNKVINKIDFAYIPQTEFDTGAIREVDFMIFEGDVTNKIKSYIPFGLSSTQAVISNNGSQHFIYEPTITGKTRILKATKGTQNWIEISADETRDTVTYDYKLDSVGGNLGSVPSASDYVDRAKKVKFLNTKDILLNENTIWTDVVGVAMSTVILSNAPYDALVRCISDKFETVSRQDGQSGVKKGVLYVKDNTLVYVYKTGETLQTAKDKVNNTTVRYQLAAPQEAALTDEEFKVYDAFKKLILLGGVGDVRNTLEIKEDGSGLINKKNINLSNIENEAWKLIDDTKTNTNLFSVSGFKAKYGLNPTIALCNSFNWGSSSISGQDYESFFIGNDLNIRILKSKASTVEEFIRYIINNIITIICPLTVAQTIMIDKSVMPTILTDKINILECGGPVKPSSFKATLPVDRVSELLLRMAALEAKTNTKPVNVAFVDETYANSVNKIEEVIK